MRINKLKYFPLLFAFTLCSCGYKVSVISQDESKGTVTFIRQDNKIAMQAYPKDNYQFDGWFKKDGDDYYFVNGNNPWMTECNSDITYQARFETLSTNTFYFELEKEGETQIPSYYSIASYYGENIDITIPNIHYGFPVKEIKAKTFVYRDDITTINIPKNISIIGNDAFKGCTKINTITIDHPLLSCGTAFTDWTEYQTIYLSSDCFKDNKTKTVWEWNLSDSGSGYYTSADCGSAAVHIVEKN